MIDYKIMNALACFISFALYWVYVRSGKYTEVRSSLFVIAVFLAYFGSIYALAIAFAWDTTTLSAWLRPPFSVDRLAIGFLFIEIVWGERIYNFLRKILKIRERKNK